jgi:hypothetical protein
MPRTQVTGKANFSPGITSGSVIRNHKQVPLGHPTVKLRGCLAEISA